MEDPAPRVTASLDRLATGIPGLDTILHGGLLRGGLYLTEGQPGAGKTIFGNQLAFAHAAAGGRVLYLTLLTESHARMLAHLRSLAFFDETAIGDSVYYLSGFQTLERDGLAALLGFTRHAVRERRATMLVLDGLTTTTEFIGSELSMRRFIQELQLYLEALGCTAMLLARPDDAKSRAEHTTVDGVFVLGERRGGAYVERVAEVSKFRGSAYLRGSHNYDIDERGLSFRPRTEARYASATSASASGTCAFGTARLDAMVGGGLPTGSNCLVLGGPGAGKTILGLQFLAHGAAIGERGLFFGFHQAPDRLIATGERLGFGLGDSVKAGIVSIHRDATREFGLDALVERLLAEIDRQAPRRLVLDGLSGFQRATLDTQRLERFWGALGDVLRRRGITTLNTAEMPEFFGLTVTVPIPGLAEVTDAIIFLRTVELYSQRRRSITIMKLRDAEPDRAVREFSIGDGGITVAEPFAGAEGILTGVARPILGARYPGEPSATPSG